MMLLGSGLDGTRRSGKALEAALAAWAASDGVCASCTARKAGGVCWGMHMGLCCTSRLVNPLLSSTTKTLLPDLFQTHCNHAHSSQLQAPR